jgi:hypothetical protein
VARSSCVAGRGLPAAGTAADAVLAGWFPEFTMPALEAACHAVWDGATLYSASQTPFFAVDGGRALGTLAGHLGHDHVADRVRGWEALMEAEPDTGASLRGAGRHRAAPFLGRDVEY